MTYTDKGHISTYLIGLSTIFYGFLLAHPYVVEEFFEKHSLSPYSPLILGILIFTFNYFYPRNSVKKKRIVSKLKDVE